MLQWTRGSPREGVLSIPSGPWLSLLTCGQCRWRAWQGKCTCRHRTSKGGSAWQHPQNLHSHWHNQGTLQPCPEVSLCTEAWWGLWSRVGNGHPASHTQGESWPCWTRPVCHRPFLSRNPYRSLQPSPKSCPQVSPSTVVWRWSSGLPMQQNTSMFHHPKMHGGCHVHTSDFLHHQTAWCANCLLHYWVKKLLWRDERICQSKLILK